MISPCYHFTRPPHTPIEITVHAHADDVSLFWSDQSQFYSRCVKDLDSLTKILHSRYYCCIHICRESQNVQRHMVATLRLDDIITFLEWIVSQYVVIKPTGIDISDRRRLGMSRYDDHAYEALLARAYNLRILQSHEHSNTPINILYGYPDVACCYHYYRPHYTDDKVYPEHWFTRSDAIVRPIPSPFHYLPHYHFCHLPFTAQEYSDILRNLAQVAGDTWCRVRSLVEQASNQEQDIPYLPLFVPVLTQLRWLKNHDHIRESFWQELLSYLSTMYHVLYYYGRIDRGYIISAFYPLYVASNAVRSNDLKLNPLQHRRLTVIRDLATTDATKVYVHLHTREIPYQSILQHLFCPNSITESIGTNIQFFCKNVYMVDDVHAITGSRFRPFQTNHFPAYTSFQDRYLKSIMFLDSVLRHYSNHNVHPIYLIRDLALGHCFATDDEKFFWQIHLEESRKIPSDSGDYRQYLTIERLQAIHQMADTSSSYIMMNDHDLHFIMLTLQQYLVEYGLHLNGEAMDWVTIREIYDFVGYRPLSENRTNLQGFTGFNLRELHRILLKFWFHSDHGLFTDLDYPSQYLQDFLHRIDVSLATDTIPAMLPRMTWFRTMLRIVITILKKYIQNTLRDYRVEDKIRVTFLAWEKVLTIIDAIDKPLVKNWDVILLTEIRLVYVKYHTNINYVHVDNLFIEDSTIFNIAGRFPPPPPESSFIQPRLSPVGHSSSGQSQQRPHFTTSSTAGPFSPASGTFSSRQQALVPSSSSVTSLQQQLLDMKNTIASLQLEVATKDRLLQQTQSQQHPKLYADFSSSSLSAPAPLHSLRPKGDLEEDQCLQDALRISQMEYHFPVGPVGSRTQLLTLPLDQSLSPTTSSPLIPTAYPADHMDKITQFASTIKQDSQIQAFALSQASTTVYPVMAKVVSSDSTTTLSSPPITGRRLQPTPVNIQNKRQHFPTKVHNYFVQDDYPPLHPCEEEFLDHCIIQHCCRNNIMMQLPLMSEDLLQHLRRFQTDNLLQHKVDTYVVSSLLLEVMMNYVENTCVIRRSTIPFAGDGLFLLPGKSFPRGLLLPYSGTIQSGATISPEALLSDDKYVCLRPNIYLKGSDSYTFPITGTTYPPYLAKANELVCSNMHENNQGKIINSGMVLFEDGILGSPTSHTEVFVLYSPLLNSYQALIDEPPHRTLLKKQVLPFMLMVVSKIIFTMFILPSPKL